eukprot:364795-Chlamydomonas_euryale.AAC.13
MGCGASTPEDVAQPEEQVQDVSLTRWSFAPHRALLCAAHVPVDAFEPTRQGVIKWAGGTAVRRPSPGTAYVPPSTSLVAAQAHSAVPAPNGVSAMRFAALGQPRLHPASLPLLVAFLARQAIETSSPADDEPVGEGAEYASDDGEEDAPEGRR